MSANFLLLHSEEVALYPVLEQLEAVPGASWDQADFMSILRKARSGVDMSMKPFMKILRYALSGTRVRFFI